nr:hypothetical protein [Tanacetum cinerariifolium]
MESQSKTIQTISILKLPMLKTGDYDLCSMRIERYLTYTDYAIWEVIVNDNAPASIASVSGGGAEAAIPPKTTEQKITRKNELKAKITLLLAILDEHLLKFHGIKDAKTLWEAIKTSYLTGRCKSKVAEKSTTSLEHPYTDHANKSDLNPLSMDELYNKLKVYEAEIKGHSSSRPNYQNVAFVTSDKTSSTNEAVNTAHNVFAASSQG